MNPIKEAKSNFEKASDDLTVIFVGAFAGAKPSWH
jgi:hypothetical protein